MTEISPTTDSRRHDNGATAAAAVVVCPPPEQVKMAAIAMNLNIRLRSSDMPSTMQEHALRHTYSILHTQQHGSTAARPNLTVVARSLKQEFDKMYGPAWHCVAGKSFGSFVTHTPGGFLYFTVDDSLSVLLFKTEVRLVL